MQFLLILVLGGAVFGVCFLLDKGFSKCFRGKKEHRSGLAVRLSKRYSTAGILLTAAGVAAAVYGGGHGWLAPVGGAVVALVGLGLVLYYLTFGVFYDEDGFLLTTFGRRSRAYRYRDIRGQRLYQSYGNLIVELYLADGRTVQLHGAMEGMYPFLDYAFEKWLAQTGRRREECPFYDPQNSCWFPSVEE